MISTHPRSPSDDLRRPFILPIQPLQRYKSNDITSNDIISKDIIIKDTTSNIINIITTRYDTTLKAAENDNDVDNDNNINNNNEQEYRQGTTSII